MVRFSRRIEKVNSSPTLKLLRIKNKLIAEGNKVLDFGAGEPDFATPEIIKQAGINAIKENFTKYTPASGIMDLKLAISKNLKEELNYEPDTSEIIITPGSKFGIYSLIQAVLNKDEEVIIPLPYWVSYPEIVKLAEGKVVYANHLDKDNLFEITAKSYIDVYTEKTRAIILNSPSNPTGMLIKEEELIKIIEFFFKKDVLIIIDDCYRNLIYNNEKFPEIFNLVKGAKDNIALVSSLSKTYSMTGWRIGYTIATKGLTEAMLKIQQHSTSNPCSISQKAALEGLIKPKPYILDMINEYKRRRDYIADFFNKLGNINFKLPNGAFYFFADFSYYIEKKGYKDDNEFAMDILEKLKIIVVPGSAFGAKNYLRISYATSFEDIKNGLNKIKDFIK